MSGRWWDDDDQVLTALGQALRRGRDVPRSFVEAGKNAFPWSGLDAELAELAYDSAQDTGRVPALTRAAPASLRSVTFASATVTIELTLTPEQLDGQVIPPQSGEVELLVASGPAQTAEIDGLGRFRIRPIPSRSFRLHCRTEDSERVLTDWVAL
jgi:hypothetical protein